MTGRLPSEEEVRALAAGQRYVWAVAVEGRSTPLECATRSVDETCAEVRKTMAVVRTSTANDVTLRGLRPFARRMSATERRRSQGGASLGAATSGVTAVRVERLMMAIAAKASTRRSG
jgi:hypothetical protein